jgi:hypothetical protein
MSIENEQLEDLNNEQLRKQLEEKYNINLDIQTEIGEKIYWDLREYFTKQIKQDNLLIPTDWGTMCCHRTDIEGMKEEFNKQLNELTKYESNEVCEDPDRELLESAIRHPCQYSANSNLENNDNIQQDTPPPYI